MGSSEHRSGGGRPVARSASPTHDVRQGLFARGVSADASEPEVEGKWPRRKTLLFIIVTCSLAWAAIIAAVVALFL